MENTNWLKQTPAEPLFPNVLWSRPENKRFAGKLLIIGGHKQSFNAVSEAYAASLEAGIGTVRVILPQSLQNMLKSVFPEAEYAPANPIGSFSREALAAWLEAADWADGVLLVGDFGRNSETAILLESFLEKYQGILGITGDTIDYLLKAKSRFKQSSRDVITAPLNMLQKLAIPEVGLKQQDALAQMVNKLGELTKRYKASFITFHTDNLIVASDGRVSTTPTKDFNEIMVATYATVWRLQQQAQSFQALTTAVYCYVHRK